MTERQNIASAKPKNLEVSAARSGWPGAVDRGINSAPGSGGPQQNRQAQYSNFFNMNSQARESDTDWRFSVLIGSVCPFI